MCSRNAVLRKRSPDRKNVFQEWGADAPQAASTLRALPRALPVASGAVPYGALGGVRPPFLEGPFLQSSPRPCGYFSVARPWMG